MFTPFLHAQAKELRAEIVGLKNQKELDATILRLEVFDGVNEPKELSEQSFDPERDGKHERFASAASYGSETASETASSSDGTEQKLDELQQLMRQLLQQSTANVTEQVKNDTLVDDNLHLSPTTVKTMLSHIYNKLENIDKNVQKVNAQHGIMTALTVVDAMTPRQASCAAASSTSSNPFDE